MTTAADPSEFDHPVDASEFDEEPKPHISTKPAAPFIPEHPPTFGESISASIDALTQPFKDLGRGVLDANAAAARAITHPIQTFGGGKAGAVVREGMRGVNSNIPFANSAVKAMGGPPAVSPQDAAAAPGFQSLGGMLGTPVAGMVGGVLAKPVEAAVPVLGRALGGLTKDAAAERQVTRAVEDLGERVTKKATRAGVKTEPVVTLVNEHPELRAAAGNDAKLTEALEPIKEAARKERALVYAASEPKVDVLDSINEMGKRIRQLRKGTESDILAAEHLETIRDRFAESMRHREALSPEELRGWQSDYEKKAYGKAMPGDHAASASIKAYEEAQKAVGDSLIRHVTGMDYATAKEAAKLDPEGLKTMAGPLFKANQELSGINRIEAAMAERASRVQPKMGLGGQIEHISHTVKNPGLAVAGKALQIAPRAADAALARFGAGPDGMLARIVQAAKEGNPFAQKQLSLVAATPAGASRIAAIQAQKAVGNSMIREAAPQ